MPRIQNLVQNPAKRELQMHMGLLGKVIGEWCPSLIGKAFRLLVGPTTVNTYPVRKSGNSLQVIAKAFFPSPLGEVLLQQANLKEHL